MPEYVDIHKNEPILATCPYCHLPIYESDSHNRVSPKNGGRPSLYHRGCNLTMKGHDLEADLAVTVRQLRELGYKLDVKISPPNNLIGG